MTRAQLLSDQRLHKRQPQLALEPCPHSATARQPESLVCSACCSADGGPGCQSSRASGRPDCVVTAEEDTQLGVRLEGTRHRADQHARLGQSATG